MLEYATRTHQSALPPLRKTSSRAHRARAMPIRVEKCANEKLKYLGGNLWGGNGSIHRSGFASTRRGFRLVDSLPSPQTAPWTIWRHMESERPAATRFVSRYSSLSASEAPRPVTMLAPWNHRCMTREEFGLRRSLRGASFEFLPVSSARGVIDSVYRPKRPIIPHTLLRPVPREILDRPFASHRNRFGSRKRLHCVAEDSLF